MKGLAERLKKEKSRKDRHRAIQNFGGPLGRWHVSTSTPLGTLGAQIKEIYLFKAKLRAIIRTLSKILSKFWGFHIFASFFNQGKYCKNDAKARKHEKIDAKTQKPV